MTGNFSKPGYRTAYLLVLVGYGFIVSLTVMTLKPLPAAVMFLSLQCLSVVLITPVHLSSRPEAPALAGRAGRQFASLMHPGLLLATGTAAALLSSFITPVPAKSILLISVFSACFAVFIAGVCLFLRSLLGRSFAQVLALGIGLSMISTPYYVNPFIRAASGALRMRVVQLAVDINPLLAGAAGILKFDWLRTPHLYQNCLIGGHQYPFHYPSAIKVGIVLCISGIILIALSALRKTTKIEEPG